jgi:hypothetical protein
MLACRLDTRGGRRLRRSNANANGNIVRKRRLGCDDRRHDERRESAGHETEQADGDTGTIHSSGAGPSFDVGAADGETEIDRKRMLEARVRFEKSGMEWSLDPRRRTERSEGSRDRRAPRPRNLSG